MNHLVVIGFDEIVANKYLSCIKEAFDKKYIDGYTIVDLKSAKKEVQNRIELVSFKPTNEFYLNDSSSGCSESFFYEDELDKVFDAIKASKSNVKVYIATEVRSHDKYLEYCLVRNFSSLTEKPVIAPMDNGMFTPNAISERMKKLYSYLEQSDKDHSVMTLSRYHPVYNDRFIDILSEKVVAYEAPITSVHLRHAGGVWNTHDEYLTREDHPYKYGYGMIMHGSYHYIDIVIQLLELNRRIYKDDNLILKLCSYVAHPNDQNARMSKYASTSINDYNPEWCEKNDYICFGETDITTTFTLNFKESNRVLTIGTISLEQTTPSVRTWENIPGGLYNKNGRTSSVDVEAQLSTIYSKTVKVYDEPTIGVKSIERFPGRAKVLTRANASLLSDEKYVDNEEYSPIYHSDSNKEVMRNWLAEKEYKSTFETHIRVMKMVEVLSMTVKKPGVEFTMDF